MPRSDHGPSWGHLRHDFAHGGDRLADFYLARLGGLSVDFDDYRLSIGSSGGDRLRGGDRRDYVWGRDGQDRLAGAGGDDVLHGQAGADLLTGGAGADRLTGGPGGDRVYGGAQADALMGGDGNDLLDEGSGHGDLDGGAGDDVLVGGPGPDAFAVGPESGNDVVKDFTAGPGMFDHLALRDLRWDDLSFADTPLGVKVMWAGGSVLLKGVRQADLAQDDFMFGDMPDLPPGMSAPTGPTPERASPSTDGPDIGPSGQGPIQRSFDIAADFFMARDGLAFDFDQFAIGVGGVGRDVLRGGDTDDHLFGRAGSDWLSGGAGDDVLQGGTGPDALDGGDGSDQLDGGDGKDWLSGGANNDGIMGGDGRDHIDAGAAHDMIEGGKGDDVIRGGTGADAFIVDPMSGHDVVLDFEATGLAQGAFDHLALRDILPGDVSVGDTRRGALVSWDVDRDSKADGSVLLEGVAVADLRQSDFMFIDEPGFVPGISAEGSYLIFA